jgi:ribosomal protein S11
MLVEHFIVGSIPILSVMYIIKIINTSNNTRILLSESRRTAKPSTKLLVQLSCGHLGFKGSTRKSSFVVSKLIQLFLKKFFSLYQSKALPFNIYFLSNGPISNYGVQLDQIRRGLLEPKGRQIRSTPCKIFDITPIPFNGCKLKKSLRK